ncbi:MAG: YezD family protein [Lachnospiraceae bacterium]
MQKENERTNANQGDYQKVMDAISSIKYGFVTVVIQDGKIVQIEKNEKERLR